MLEAAKQSGRGIIPRAEPLLSFKAAIERMKTAKTAILFYEGAATPLREILERVKPLEGGELAIMIGSEGGFSPEEAAFAAENGIEAATLGPRILRCETASVCAVSAIMYALGEL
jgi:16S rRNA (uracil1498-N3)-methyltransferase